MNDNRRPPSHRITAKAFRTPQIRSPLESLSTRESCCSSRCSSSVGEFRTHSRLSSRESKRSLFNMQRRGSLSSDNVLIDILKNQDDSTPLLKNLLKENQRKEKLSNFTTYPSNGIWHIDEVTIDSNFDSGNLGNIELNGTPISDEDSIDRRQGRRPVPDYEFRCWVSPDMEETEFENNNKSWFHFRVHAEKEAMVRFNIMNLNKHSKLFNQGMMPVVLTVPQDDKLPNILENPERWQRVNFAFPHSTNGDFVLSFWHKLTPKNDYYFSFSYPCSVRDQTEYINKLESLYSSHPSIYFHRELLCLSFDKNPVELITISSRRDLQPEFEPNFAHNLPPPLPTLATETDDGLNRGDFGSLRAQNMNKTASKFENKRVYVLSARVHPGETPASHVMKGCLDFLLRENDKRAKQLRDQFVFKIIPIINPDGVIRGHYRTDARGQNLNRHYSNPDPQLQPQCFAYRQMISYFHKFYQTEDDLNNELEDSTIVRETTHSGIAFLIDLHAHAAKRGCFLYGNRVISPKLQAEILLYARLTSANSAFMDFDACCFSERNMKVKEKRDENLSKEGSARVAFYYLTGSPHIYTLECNYNVGKFMNSIASGRSGAVTPPLPTMPNQKYTPLTYCEVGRGLLAASLDIFDFNPCPRVAPNQVKALRAQIHRQVMTKRQNGKGRITSKSTAHHVISSERLSTARKSFSDTQTTEKPKPQVKVIKKMSLVSLKDKSVDVKPKRVSKLPRLKPKQTIPQNNITISFLTEFPN